MRFVFVAGLVAAQDLNELLSSQTPPQTMPTQATSTTPMPPFKEKSDQCLNLEYNKKNGPEPSNGSMCPKYSCYSCCDDDKAQTFFSKYMTPSGDIKQYGMYHFDGCTGAAHDTSGQGHVTSRCQAFIMNNFCMSSCSPNIYPYIPEGKNRPDQIPVCQPYCDEFLAACADDHVCYNKQGLSDYLNDVIFDTVDENKDYAVFKCEEQYECKKISESLIAKPIDAEQVPAGIRPKYEEYLAKEKQGTATSERFCENFSFNMFKLATTELCIDPRYEHTVIEAVHLAEEAYNKKNPTDQRDFVTSEPCPTGLSVGAIVGIVIGVLVGVGLIAGLTYYFACASKNPEDDYTEGKQTDRDAEQPPTNNYSMSQKNEPARDKSIVTSEADYVPSRTESSK